MSKSSRNSSPIDTLNATSTEELRATFKAVCHADRWVEAMLEGLPYDSPEQLRDHASKAWAQCERADWRQALDGHPRIGQKAKGNDLASRWSRTEQSQAGQDQDESVKAELADVQEAYYQKFGFIFLIFASGRSSAEILEVARERIQHSEDQEWPIVSQELAKIIDLRLERHLA